MATKYSPNAHDYAQGNNDKAEASAESYWTAFTQPEKDTWQANSRFNTPSQTKDTSGKQEFMHYMMQLFGSGTNQNASFFATATASNATSNNWADRASWIWATT